MTKRGYTCPNCNNNFINTTDDSTCPNCKAKLKSMRRKRGRAFEYYYVLDVAQELPRTTEPIINEGVLVSPKGEHPEVWEVIEGKRYRVVYTEPIFTSGGWWIFCPFCEKRLFENGTLAGYASQNHKCKCGMHLEFIFQLPIGPFGRIMPT